VIEIICVLQLDAGNGTITQVYGVTLDVAKVIPWEAATLLAVAGGVLFHIAGRYFKKHWNALRVEIEARLRRGFA
jgi:hypothetical protein